MTTPPPGRPPRRFDDVVQVLIMLAVAGMAGAASFRHVHDWTMHNSPAGTGDWFGWANAMVTELIPLAAGLEARRRHRHGGKAGLYPIALILGAVGLSLTGQFAEASDSLSGWIISAIPAVGFLALVKLVLSRPAAPTGPTPADPASAQDNDTPSAHDAEVVTAEQLVDELQPTPVQVTDTPAIPVLPAIAVPHRNIPTHLLAGARFAATQHHQATGHPITPAELAARMSLTPELATGLLTELGEQSLTTAHLNGAPVLAGETR